MRQKKQDKIIIKELAKEEIINLFTKAENVFKQNKTKSNEFIKKARKLAMQKNIKISKEFKRKYCRHCNSYLVPGKNCRVRTQPGRVVYTCLECKKFMRFVY